MRHKLSLPNLLWLAAYLAVMAGLWFALVWARQQTIAQLGNAQAEVEWQEYVQAEQRRASDPSTPVQRRLPASPEPPALVLMRDSFPAIVATALATGTFFFGFLMLVVRGVWRQRRGAG